MGWEIEGRWIRRRDVGEVMGREWGEVMEVMKRMWKRFRKGGGREIRWWWCMWGRWGK